jgi:ligand-binding sensor domain-containing protein/serine phosphatase RsbU (regulator of sigma subunit)
MAWGRQRMAELAFEHLTAQQGLSQDIVTCLAQDRRGFMWVGTEDGLNRYDGIRMRIYRNEFFNPATLSDNWVRAMLADSEGDLWVCTHNGLSRYNAAQDDFTQFHHDKQNPRLSLPSNYLISICEYKGDIWVGTGDRGLARFDRKTQTFRQYLHRPSDPNSLPNNSINALYVDQSGILWIGTSNGICRYDSRLDNFFVYKKGQRKGKQVVSYDVRCIYEDQDHVLWIGTGASGLQRFTDNRTGIVELVQEKNKQARAAYPTALTAGTVSAIFEDDTRTLWVATTEGVLRREKGETAFSVIKNTSSDPKSLSHNDVSAFYEDASRVLWIGTRGGGANIYDVHQKRFLHYRHDYKNPNSLAKDVVRAVFDDGKGNLWVGLREGGLNRLHRETGKFTHFPSDRSRPDALWAETVSAIYEDSRGDLWVGSWGDGLNRYNRRRNTIQHFMASRSPGSLTDDRIQAVIEDLDGDIWVATDGGFNRYLLEENRFISYTHDPNNSNSLSSNTVQGQAFLCDSDGYLWIGTYSGHLNRFDKRTDTFLRVGGESGRSQGQGLPDKPIISLHDQNETLWIGTDGGGLCRLNKFTQLIKCYTVEDGLPSNVIYGIKADREGNLWMSTKNGLCRFSPGTETFKNYYDYHGLQSNVFYWGAAFSNAKGEMFFGGINGLTVFDPADIEENTYMPPVHLTAFKINNTEVPIGPLPSGRVLLDRHISSTASIELGYGDRYFSFDFAALNYSHPERNRYRYMMEGFDEQWRYTDASNATAPYTNLPAGTYTFKVMGANNDGLWNNKGVSLRVVMRPPWWRTWWAQGLGVLLVGTLAYGYYLNRVRRLQRQKIALLEQVRLRTAEILKKNAELQSQQSRIVKQNERIQSSINYARRIQRAMMPVQEEIEATFSDYFIFFQPRDVVSGDFYWMTHLGDRTFIAAVDCTGHGVPGAFMSMVGLDLLKETVNMRGITDVGEILAALHDGVRHSLHQEESQNRDGMDMALCMLERLPSGQIQLSYAGAHNPLVYVQQGEMHVVKADRIGIGGDEVRHGEGQRTYQKHCIPIESTTEIYLYSDGFQDQFGGDDGRKMMSKNFKRLLFSMHQEPMERQRELLAEHFEAWKGEREQTDDVLVIGIRINPHRRRPNEA